MPDEKVPNAALFVVSREDHTVGNLMRMCVPPLPRPRRCSRRPRAPTPPPSLLPRLLASRRELLRDPRVKFSGYKHPHPLDNDIIFRVQTGPGVVPSAAFISAANHLEQEFRALQGRLAEELRRVRDEAAPFE